MRPLVVTAHLGAPCIPGGPILLDAILFAGLSSAMGADRPDGWEGLETIRAHAEGGGLPLARVETPHGWWWAASQAVPAGPEATVHKHRRPDLAAIERWTDARSVNVAAGPDKLLRIPHYYRPGWRVLRWTAVGDPGRVAAMLLRVPAVGRLVTDGWGWVDRWEVRSEDGPVASEYAQDLRLRHLPAAAVALGDLPRDPLPARRELPLRPPYHERGRAVTCWQIAREG